MDQDTDCLHPNGVLLLLSLPALRKLNIQKSSDDLAMVMVFLGDTVTVMVCLKVIQNAIVNTVA